MMNRVDGQSLNLENLQETVVRIPVRPPRHSLRKDVIETITGISSSAITAGGKIAAETVVYSGQSTPGQETAGLIFSILSLIANCIDFVMIPLGYLYKLYSKEKIPFNFSNNLKWILAGVTLTLAIISFVVNPAARIISFMSVGISLATATYTFIKYFYDRNMMLNSINEKKAKVDSVCSAIRNDMRLINQLYDDVRLLQVSQPRDSSALQPQLVMLDQHHQQYRLHIDELKCAYQERVQLERTFQRFQSPLEIISNTIKTLMAGVVLAGTILSLNPVTLPVGMPIIAAAALITLMALIAQKCIEIVQKRVAYQQSLVEDSLVSIKITSTATIIKSCKVANVISDQRSKDLRSVDNTQRESNRRDGSFPQLSDSDDEECEVPDAKSNSSLLSLI